MVQYSIVLLCPLYKSLDFTATTYNYCQWPVTFILQRDRKDSWRSQGVLKNPPPPLHTIRMTKCKAYIPPERKIPGVGGWRWAMPPTPAFCVGDTNMLVYFGVTPDANPRRQSVEYRWRWVLALGLCVGHVHFMR